MVIEVYRTSFAEDGTPIRVTVTVYPADRNQIVYDIGDVPGDPEAPSDQRARTKGQRLALRNPYLQKSGLPGHCRLLLLLLRFRRPAENAGGERMPEEGPNAGAKPHDKEAGHGKAGHDSLACGYPRIWVNRQVSVVLALRPVDRRG